MKPTEVNNPKVSGALNNFGFISNINNSGYLLFD
jgi:hypothetical protein